MIPALICAAFALPALALTARLFVDYPRAPLARSVMSAREQALIGAVADAYFPPGGPIPVSGREAGLVAYFDGYLARSGRTQRFLMRLLITFTELSPLLFGPRFARFSRLTHEEQIKYLHDAFTSRIYFRRLGFISLRALMTMAYLANDRVAAHMHMSADLDPFHIGDRVLEQPVRFSHDAPRPSTPPMAA
jgi:hypothetical protein